MRATAGQTQTSGQRKQKGTEAEAARDADQGVGGEQVRKAGLKTLVGSGTQSVPFPKYRLRQP